MLWTPKWAWSFWKSLSAWVTKFLPQSLSKLTSNCRPIKYVLFRFSDRLLTSSVVYLCKLSLIIPHCNYPSLLPKTLIFLSFILCTNSWLLVWMNYLVTDLFFWCSCFFWWEDARWTKIACVAAMSVPWFGIIR